MTKPINEIMMTLFNNSNGLTLSVLVNANSGGKPVNFSLKGDNTLNFKAINDGLSNMDDNMRAYFQETKAKFKDLNIVYKWAYEKHDSAKVICKDSKDAKAVQFQQWQH